MTHEQLVRMTAEQAKRFITKARRTLSGREVNVKYAGLGHSRAFYNMRKGGGLPSLKIKVNGKTRSRTRNELLSEAWRAQQIMNDPTSTVEGMRKQHEKATRAFFDLGNEKKPIIQNKAHRLALKEYIVNPKIAEHFDMVNGSPIAKNQKKLMRLLGVKKKELPTENPDEFLLGLFKKREMSALNSTAKIYAELLKVDSQEVREFWATIRKMVEAGYTPRVHEQWTSDRVAQILKEEAQINGYNYEEAMTNARARLNQLRAEAGGMTDANPLVALAKFRPTEDDYL